MASATATASPTSAATTVAATIAATVTVTAAAKILSRTVAAAAGRVVLCRIVLRREILRRGSVGIRLTLLKRFDVLIFNGSGRSCFVMLLRMLLLRGVRFLRRFVMLFGRSGFLMMELFVVHFLVML